MNEVFERISIYEMVLDQIVEKLGGTPTEPINLAAIGLKVEKIPEFKKDYLELKPSEPGRVVVAFGKNRYGTMETRSSILTGDSAMERDIFFAVSVSARRLYNVLGLLQFIEIVQRLLLGMHTVIGGSMSFYEDEMADNEDNTFYWHLTMRLSDVPIQSLDNYVSTAPETLTGLPAPGGFVMPEIPLIKDIDFIDEEY